MSADLLDRRIPVELAISAELILVEKHGIDGVYVIPKLDTPREWVGVIFVRRGLYQGGIFRFDLKIPVDFPDTSSVPQLTFEQSIFHPFVDPETNDLDLGRYFPEGWKKGTHHIYHALVFAQRAFYKFTEIQKDALNEIASTLYQSNIERFRERVADSVRRSREIVYDKPTCSDSHAIRFTPWDPSVHEPFRRRILTNLRLRESVRDPSVLLLASDEGNSESSRNSEYAQVSCGKGLSWVDASTLSILTAKKK